MIFDATEEGVEGLNGVFFTFSNNRCPLEMIPAPEPEPAPEPTPEPESFAAPVQFPKNKEEYEKTPIFPWWIILVVILGLAAIALCVFIIIAQINPESLYPILYSPEELEILNS